MVTPEVLSQKDDSNGAIINSILDTYVDKLLRLGEKYFFNLLKTRPAQDIERYLDINVHFNLNCRDAWDRTPLMVAALRGDLAIVNLLIRRGANVADEVNRNGSAIFHAAGGGKIDVVKRLMELGLSVHEKITSEYRGLRGQTPIFMAVSNVQVDMVLFLIQQNCNILAQDAVGRLPAHYLKGNDSVRDLLLSTPRATTRPLLTSHTQNMMSPRLPIQKKPHSTAGKRRDAAMGMLGMMNVTNAATVMPVEDDAIAVARIISGFKAKSN